MAHIQASQIANRYLNSIKANSSATNIQTAQNIMRAELLTLDQQLKIQAQTQLVGNSSAIVAAHKGINQALSVWSPENIHMSQRSPLVAGQGLPTTTPFGGNSLTSPLSGTTNLYQPPSVGTGFVTTGFQNHQPLLPGTTALQEVQLSNISRPESGLRRTRPESLSHRTHIDPSRVRQDNRIDAPPMADKKLFVNWVTLCLWQLVRPDSWSASSLSASLQRTSYIRLCSLVVGPLHLIHAFAHTQGRTTSYPLRKKLLGGDQFYKTFLS